MSPKEWIEVLSACTCVLAAVVQLGVYIAQMKQFRKELDEIHSWKVPERMAVLESRVLTPSDEYQNGKARGKGMGGF